MMLLFLPLLLVLSWNFQGGLANDEYEFPGCTFEFEKELLRLINNLRAKHSAPPLKIKQSISRHSQKWAHYLAARDLEGHQRHPRYMFDMVYKGIAGYDDSILVLKPADVLRKWTTYLDQYPYFGAELFGELDQYTYSEIAQLLWVNTTSVGFGCKVGLSKSVPNAKVYVVVANYDPAGNQLCHFKKNVLPPQGSPMDRNMSAWINVTDPICVVPHPMVHMPGPCSSSWSSQLIALINDLRNKHGTPPLEYSNEISRYSHSWANWLGDRILMNLHQPNNKYRFDVIYSEFNAAYNNTLAWHLTPAHVFKGLWNDNYDETYNYYGTEPINEKERWNQAIRAQLLWKGTKKIGVGCGWGDEGFNVVVINFEPYGNIKCQYKENVLPEADTLLYEQITTQFEVDPSCAVTSASTKPTDATTTSKPEFVTRPIDQ